MNSDPSYRVDLPAGERLRLNLAHSCHEAASFIGLHCPRSAQAQRLRAGLLACRDHLWPDACPADAPPTSALAPAGEPEAPRKRGRPRKVSA